MSRGPPTSSRSSPTKGGPCLPSRRWLSGFGMPPGTPDNAGRSPFWSGSSFRITFMSSGKCPRGMLIIPIAGKCSRRHFPGRSRGRVYRTAPGGSGNPGFGNMPYATKRITTAISITFITIRSSMAWPPRPGIGRTVRSGDTCARDGIRPIGERPCRRSCGRWIANNPGQAAGRGQPVDAGPRECRWMRCRPE